jgi:hypothetical protein
MAPHPRSTCCAARTGHPGRWAAPRLIAAAVLLALPPGTLSCADAQGEAAAAAAYDTAIHPLLSAYCTPCHRADKAKGDLNLEQYASGAAALRARAVWKEVGEKLHTQEMPPAKAERHPAAGERELIERWIISLRAFAPSDPGRVVARRLNRNEYDNTMRDLLGVEGRPAADFPLDDQNEGFDNIAAALSVSPLLMEKYLAAVDTILDQAIVPAPIDLRLSGLRLALTSEGTTSEPGTQDGARTLSAAGEVALAIGVPKAGRYQLRLRLGAEQAGAEPVRVAVRIDDKAVEEFKVLAPAKAPAPHALMLTLAPGTRRIAVAFLNPGGDDRPAARAGAKAAAAAAPAKRALVIDSLQLQGPPGPPPSEVQNRLLVAKPGAELGKRDAARQIAERFARRAYRRPPSAYEAELLLRVFDLADRNGEVFEEAVKLMLKAALLSPQFLFRIERDHSAGADGAYALDDYELASRLSYFLWSSMPDEELFAAAAQGTLHQPEVLAGQARRMLKDRKAQALVENFAGQWLQLRNVLSAQPDDKLFPGFDQGLRQALYDEGIALFGAVLREDLDIGELIDCDYAFLNERLARHYGIAGVSGPQLRKVALTDRTRGGVLGLGAVLVSTSNPSRTSPVKRGKWVLEQLLDLSPPPPPPLVASLDQQPAATSSGQPLSGRQRLEAHRADPACAGCHLTMDAIGFGLDNFDPVGKWRADEGGIAIDAAGALAGEPFSGVVALKAVLLKRKGEVIRCLARKLLTYATGRLAIDADELAIDRMVAGAHQRLGALIIELVQSYPFRFRHGAGDQAVVAVPGGATNK